MMSEALGRGSQSGIVGKRNVFCVISGPHECLESSSIPPCAFVIITRTILKEEEEHCKCYKWYAYYDFLLLPFRRKAIWKRDFTGLWLKQFETQILSLTNIWEMASVAAFPSVHRVLLGYAVSGRLERGHRTAVFLTRLAYLPHISLHIGNGT